MVLEVSVGGYFRFRGADAHVTLVDLETSGTRRSRMLKCVLNGFRWVVERGVVNFRFRTLLDIARPRANAIDNLVCGAHLERQLQRRAVLDAARAVFQRWNGQLPLAELLFLEFEFVFQLPVVEISFKPHVFGARSPLKNGHIVFRVDLNAVRLVRLCELEQTVLVVFQLSQVLLEAAITASNLWRMRFQVAVNLEQVVDVRHFGFCQLDAIVVSHCYLRYSIYLYSLF